MTVRIEEMTWIEYAARIKKGGVVVFLPVGSLEQHGPHLPMHCDEVIPRALSEAVAEIVGGLVTPSVTFGYKSQPRSGGGNHLPGTISMDADVVIGQVRDIIVELARHGVRQIVVMDGHYENTMFITEGIDLALRSMRFDGVKDMKVLRVGYYEFTSNEAIRKVWPDGFPGWPLEHAGVMETSVMLYLFPDLVHMDRVPTHPPAVLPAYDVFPATAENWPGLPRSGALNSAGGATGEKGAILFEEYVNGIHQAVLREFKVRCNPTTGDGGIETTQSSQADCSARR
jgi:creatinine amidohydrolase